MMFGWFKKKPELPPEPVPRGKAQFVTYVKPPVKQLKPLDTKSVSKIVIHRCSLWDWKPKILDGDLSAEIMQKAFTTDKELGTGLAVPYHVLVRGTGLIEQMLPLTARGAHARAHNPSSIAVCVAGSKAKAPPWQLEALARTVAILQIYAPMAEIVGHTDLPDGSKDPNKKCPEPVINLSELHELVYKLRPADLASWSTERRMEVVRAAGFEI